jgi:glycosyltransferase involved in cell wall biosynthesis
MSSVDVIVPCYRYGHFLRQCVESVLSQSLPNVRILVIDDASPDNTAEIAAELVRKDCRVTFLRHTTNKGHINTYNEGIDWASGDYMLILSADDYLLPGALRRSADLMDGHPEVGFTFGRGIELNNTGTTPQLSDTVDIARKGGWRIVPGRQFIELSGARNIVSTPTAVVRTELQKQLGGYRPELPHSGDMEMWLRFAAHGSVGILESYQAVYRRHSSNMSLAYMTRGWLPDIQQRKAALDCFFEMCTGWLPNPGQLRRRMYRSVACASIGLASTAFNDGEMGLSEQLSEFALDVCPDIKKSLPWMKLACKRHLGFRMWQILSLLCGRADAR